MSDWAGGYVADVEYAYGFHKEQAPAFMDFVGLLNGHAPHGQRDGYTYCELGCGQGVTVATLAAADPRGQFYGVDFNPAHVANAQALVDAAGLDNLHLTDASFGELVDDESLLPQFDFVSLHGVYSWVAPEVREQILRFLDRKVKPGGVVYISYNSLPGWTQSQPIQHLIYELADRETGSSTERSDGCARPTFRRLSDAGARELHPDNGALKHILDLSARGDILYLAHEYMTRHWIPVYFHDSGGTPRHVPAELSSDRPISMKTSRIFAFRPT